MINRADRGLSGAGSDVSDLAVTLGCRRSIRKSSRWLPIMFSGQEQMSMLVFVQGTYIQGGNSAPPQRQVLGSNNHFIPVPVTWGMSLPWIKVARQSSAGSFILGLSQSRTPAGHRWSREI